MSPEFFTGPSKNSFVNLSKVHTGRYTKWVKYDINRCSVFEERHIFFTNNTCNNTFIPVATCHFITYFQFTFFSNINFCHLNNTVR